jgi:hypothetical protein
MLFNFRVHEDTFRAYFHKKKYQEKVGRKFIMVRIQNRIRIRTFLKVGSGSGQKSSGSTTLLVTKNLEALTVEKQQM